MVILSIISSLSLMLSPLYIGNAVDVMVYQSTNFDMVKTYLFIVIVCYGVHFVTTVFLNLIAYRLSVNEVFDKRNQMHGRLLKLPMSHLDLVSTAKIQNLIGNDSNRLADGLALLLSQTFVSGFTVLIAVFMMLSVNVMMTITVLVFSPFLFLISTKIGHSSLKAYREQQSALDDLSSYTRNNLQSHVLIKDYNYEDDAIKEFIEHNRNLNEKGIRAQVLSSYINPSSRLVNNLLNVFIAIAGAYVFWNGAITIGGFLSFTSYLLMYTKPVNELSAMFADLIAAKASNERIRTFLKLPIEEDSSIDFKGQDIDIGFKNVDFAYTKDQELIQNLNLCVENKSKLAIVGPTGAGKSTMINLLMRYYNPTSGKILFDDAELNDYSRQSIRHKIGIVLQEPWVYDGTIFENIAYGDEDASLEDVIIASKQAMFHDVVMQFEEGYDSNASRLSLGEKQMLTIARALLLEQEIYILDEATSNLDSLTEYKIQEAFQKIMENHTSVVIAHRLHTIQDAKTIIVMKDGKIIEQGNHDELMEAEGFYKNLYESQF